MQKYANTTADVIGFFCQRIAEANWKILKLLQHFIADRLNNWISKAEYLESLLQVDLLEMQQCFLFINEEW